MKLVEQNLGAVCLLEPTVHGDERGFFFESYNEQNFTELVGFQGRFVQDNHSRSERGVLRGLHYQLEKPQGKLVRVLSGEIFDVAVDLRSDSKTYGEWWGVSLNSENRRQLWVPEGFAHGFLVTSPFAEVAYKTTEFYDPKSERSIRWNDDQLAIAWPQEESPILSSRDAGAGSFSEAETF